MAEHAKAFSNHPEQRLASSEKPTTDRSGTSTLDSYLALELNNSVVAAPDSYEAVFIALAHPSRRRILTALNFAGGTLSAGKIAGLFAHAWPTTTRHLQQLEDAGLVAHERQGRTRLYHLKSGRLALARDWLDWFDKDPVSGTRKDRQNDEFPAAIPTQPRGWRS
jgi:DNA-binding transcriptional ArsR family regulator